MLGRLAAVVAVLAFGVGACALLVLTQTTKEGPPRECRKPWTDGISSPERFDRIADCVLVSGTVVSIERQENGSDHILLELDSQEAANRLLLLDDTQWVLGRLSIVVEPWQRGEGLSPSTYRHPISRCRFTMSCTPSPGDRVRVLSVIVANNWYGGRSEAHSPTWIGR